MNMLLLLACLATLACAQTCSCTPPTGVTGCVLSAACGVDCSTSAGCNALICTAVCQAAQATSTNPASCALGITGACASSGSCFHESTMITYGQEQLSMAQLENHDECAIPHVVTEQGLIITARCAAETKVLRLTAGHLVYTKRGLQAAKDVTTLDVLFSDLDEKNSCSVVSITREPAAERYFGLNCHSSQVLASGIKSSTFEKLHAIPSFWMAIMGRILGIKQASRIGDHIEQLVAKMNLI